MALNPQDKDALTRYTMVAKKIIYDAERMKQFMQMLGSKAGALQAVHAVMSIIEKNRPIPPNMAPLLGVNIYMLMVDVAQQATQHQPDPAIIQEVIGQIVSTIGQGQSEPQEEMQEGQLPGQPEEPDAPQNGIIARQMQGAAA